MKAALLSLVTVLALASSADARPPRFSANNAVPARTVSFYDDSRYGSFLSPSDPRGSFSTYGVPYAQPYYRSGNGPVNPPTPTYTPRGGFIGTYNGGIFGSRR